MGQSEALRREILEIKCNGQEALVKFRNGSTIECVTSSDTSRGYRANTIILDEYRLIKKEILDSVLRKFNAAPRKPPYMFKDEYKDWPQENNTEMYISSAWFKNHWSYEKFLTYRNSMCKGSSYFVCDLPYTVALEHGLLTQQQVDNVRQEDDMDELSWEMEMNGMWYGESSGAFFKSTEINPLRSLTRAFYPPTDLEYLQSKSKRKTFKSSIPKQPNEIRIIGADIALSAGKENDNSIYSLLRMLPDGDGYRKELVHIESYNGVSSERQAQRLKELFYDFESDFIIIDSQGIQNAH